jgi:hypothetical protein
MGCCTADLNVSVRTFLICKTRSSTSAAHSCLSSPPDKNWHPFNSSRRRILFSAHSFCSEVFVRCDLKSISVGPGVLEGRWRYGTGENRARMRVYRYICMSPLDTQYTLRWNYQRRVRSKRDRGIIFPYFMARQFVYRSFFIKSLYRIKKEGVHNILLKQKRLQRYHLCE